MIWCFLSSVLFDCYETSATGALYELPDRSCTTKIQMIGYFDDSNGQANTFMRNKQPDAKVLLKQATDDAQIWHDILWASGGELELSKCSYQLLSWTFSPSGAPSLTTILPVTHVTVNDIHRTKSQIIPAISAHLAYKTLGHYKDPAGNQRQQLTELQLKCDKTANVIARSPLLNHHEA